ncbi:MAG: dihydroorotase [Leptolyngbya sp. SIO4C1]|nr:dihydroorotase [Leptolyngbya sp. SIO4C1]
MGTLIRQVRLINPLTQTDSLTDVLLTNGRIAAIASELEPAAWHRAIETVTEIATIEAEGWILGPGLIDLYSHSSEPGHESRETLADLCQAALAGGFTRVGLLPTTLPPLDHPAQIAQLSQPRSRAPRLLPWGCLTLGAQGQRLCELAELSAAGAVGFSDGQPIANPVLLQRLLEYAQSLERPVALWPCDRALTAEGAAREGEDSLRLGLPGVPAIAETAALAALLECVASLGRPVHIMRLSTARGVDLVRQAKAQGLPITASVTWHHLLLSTRDLASYDPQLRFDPPLGTPADRAALIAGLEDSTLDAIAVDHRAYTYEEKTVAFSSAPAGALGLALALPLLWQTLVETRRWSPLQLWRYLSLQPARCLRLEPPSVSVNQPAEMLLFNPAAEWTVTSEQLRSPAANTPWLHQKLQGKVEQVWLPELL